LGVIAPASYEEVVGGKVIGTRWVHKVKGGGIKSRLVVQDFKEEGTTDRELYAGTSSMSSLSTLLALAS
jgi:hypothetical protein